MHRHFATLALTAGMAITSAPAWAAQCAKRDMVVEKLQNKYSEQLTAGGLHSARNNSAMVEVWASPETGTFTVMLTNANGVSCIMASGTDWFAAEPAVKPKGTAS